VSHDEEAIAEEAAQKALQKFFLTLGYDTSDPEEIKALQNHFRFIRRWHDSSEIVRDRSLKTAITVIVTGFLGWLGLLFWKQP
jgi:hypothetical protein